MNLRLGLSFALLAAATGCLVVIASPAGGTKVLAVEIDRTNTDLLPRGKEADGIIGDFVLRSDRVHALISGAQPLRRANMRTENAFVTPGCVYDLDLTGEQNDQLTAFRPGNAGGEVSWVRVVESSEAAGIIESVRMAAKGNGLFTRHEYRLEPGWQHLLITSTYRNESDRPLTIRPAAEWRGFENSREWTVGQVHVADATDPFDKRGYAWSFAPGEAPSQQDVPLAPGEQRIVHIALAVADSPLAAYGVVQRLFHPVGLVSGRAVDSSGSPAIHATLQVAVAGVDLPHYPDREGSFRFYLPPGSFPMKFRDLGRDPQDRVLAVEANKEVHEDLRLAPASGVRVQVRDANGGFSPAKVQFIGVDGTETPNLGTHLRAHGSDHQYFTHDGRFTQQLPPGHYLLRFTRGPEYDMEERRIEVRKDELVEVAATLKRTVDTTGWVSADFHSHSTPSGDNYCATDDRIIDLVAEQIEFAPATEHNRFVSWVPNIERLGLTRLIKSVTGIEFTSNDTHMNGFPFTLDAFTQDNGAPMYDPDVRISAMRLRGWRTPSLEKGGSRYDTYQNSRARIRPQDPPERWVQINHPSVGAMFFDRNRAGIFPNIETLFDAAEVWSADILTLSPVVERARGGRGRKAPNRTFGWLQLLNQGRNIWSVAVSDAHGVFGNGVGAWRVYLPSSTDNPEQIDPNEIVRNAKAGRMVITNGPFLEVATAAGDPIGSTVRAHDGVDLRIRVQTPNWMDINRVQILLSGRQPEQYNFTRQRNPAMFRDGAVRFDQKIHVALSRDEHLIVVAAGEGLDLSKGWGRSPVSRMQPIAYTNPIYVDVDGNGFQANRDTLGFPLMSGSGE
jgi:hypothetical protein